MILVEDMRVLFANLLLTNYWCSLFFLFAHFATGWLFAGLVGLIFLQIVVSGVHSCFFVVPLGVLNHKNWP